MIKHAGSLLLVGAAAFALTACSSGSDTASSAQAQLSRISAATENGAAASSSSASSSPSGPKVNPADVDVCALLSQADANSVAHAEELDEFQDPSTFYKLTVTKQPRSATTSSCKFSIKDAQGSGQGTAVFQVGSATHFAAYSNEKKISGLGDEAYDGGDSPVVRVGSLMIKPSEDSFSDEFTVDLLRKMIPKLK